MIESPQGFRIPGRWARGLEQWRPDLVVDDALGRQGVYYVEEWVAGVLCVLFAVGATATLEPNHEDWHAVMPVLDALTADSAKARAFVALTRVRPTAYAENNAFLRDALADLTGAL